MADWRGYLHVFVGLECFSRGCGYGEGEEKVLCCGRFGEMKRLVVVGCSTLVEPSPTQHDLA